MNGQQQRERKTAVTILEAQMVDAVSALSERFDEELGNARAESRDALSAERTHRLKLADDQRGYVDAADRQVREQLLAAIAELRGRGFWSRLNWLVTGR